MKKNIHLVEAKKKIAREQVTVDDAEVAKRIKNAVETMEDRGLPPLSYPEIAELCSVSEKNVWNWAREGKISKAKLPTLAAILGVRVEYLLTGVNPPLSLEWIKEEDSFGLTMRSHEDTHRIVPVLEPKHFLDGLGASDILEDRLAGWAKEKERFPMTSIPIVDLDDPGIPSFAMQMTNTIFSQMPKGTIMYFSHRIIPANGDFSIWLTQTATTKGAKLSVVGGYTAYEAVPDSFPGNVALGDMTALSRVHLQCNIFSPQFDDIVLEACKVGSDNKVHATRRLLGTLVATQAWVQPFRMRKHTYLERRLVEAQSAKIDNSTEMVYDF